MCDTYAASVAETRAKTVGMIAAGNREVHGARGFRGRVERIRRKPSEVLAAQLLGARANLGVGPVKLAAQDLAPAPHLQFRSGAAAQHHAYQLARRIARPEQLVILLVWAVHAGHASP